MTATNTELHPGLTKNPPPIAGRGEGREDKKKKREGAKNPARSPRPRGRFVSRQARPLGPLGSLPWPKTQPGSSVLPPLLLVGADPVSVADAEILSRHLGLGNGPKLFPLGRLSGRARRRQRLGFGGDWPGLRGGEGGVLRQRELP